MEGFNVYSTPSKQSLPEALNESLYLTPSEFFLKDTPKCRSVTNYTKIARVTKNYNALFTDSAGSPTHYVFSSEGSYSTKLDVCDHSYKGKENNFTPTKRRNGMRTPLKELQSNSNTPLQLFKGSHTFQQHSPYQKSSSCKKRGKKSFAKCTPHMSAESTSTYVPQKVDCFSLPMNFNHLKEKSQENISTASSNLFHKKSPVASNSLESCDQFANIRKEETETSHSSCTDFGFQYDAHKEKGKAEKSLIQKIMQLKLFKRQFSSFSRHASTMHPYIFISGLTRKYYKRLPLWDRLFGKRRMKEKYYVRLQDGSLGPYRSNRKCSFHSSTSVHNSNELAQMQRELLHSVHEITNRLNRMDSDIREIKDMLKCQLQSRKTDECKEKQPSLEPVVVPPPPPPPPPPPLPQTLLTLSCFSTKRFYASFESREFSNNTPVSSRKNTQKKHKSEPSFTITADELKNVKLRKTPISSTTADRSKGKHTDPRIPEVSVEMLKSVKLKPCRSRKVADRRKLSSSPYSLRETVGNRNRFYGSYKENKSKEYEGKSGKSNFDLLTFDESKC